MTKYEVLGQAKNRYTGMPVGNPRVEAIDTNKNILFKKAKNEHDVKRHYEAFWNDLNPQSRDVVEVKEVRVKQGVDKRTHKVVSSEQDFAQRAIKKFI